MAKKSILIMIILTLCALICFLGYKNMKFKVQTKGGLKTSNWSYGLGNNNGKSEFSYSIKLTNTNIKTIFIKSIQPSVNESIKNKILSKITVVNVNKNIKPNETIQINGDISIDTKGLSKPDIEKFITDIKVSTEETVSLK